VIVTVCADKGSPGVSWTAAALTMVWPGERVLLEADPSGGDAALRLRTPEGWLLPKQPTLRGLSVDARAGSLPSFDPYTHQTSLGVPVIPATDMSTEDFGLIARQWPAVAAAAHGWRGTVIADLGRLQEETASGPIAAASTVVLLVGCATVEGMYHLRERASALTARLGQGVNGQSPLAVAVNCPPREHKSALSAMRAQLDAEVSTANVSIAGWIAEDPKGLDLMRSGKFTKKLFASDLLRSASDVVQTLVSWWPQLLVQEQPAPSATTSPVETLGPAVPPPIGTGAGSPAGPSMNTTGGWS
jgi:hypothetical protein